MPFKNRARNREYQREWKRRLYKKRRELGLCYLCGKQPGENYHICPVCVYKRVLIKKRFRVENRNTLNETNKMTREKWLLGNKCMKCGAPLLEEEVRYCFACKANQ